MMTILVVPGHPRVGSLNHALAHAVCEDMREVGHDVVFHDLYAERFDPILPANEVPGDGETPATILSHCRDLCSADGLVIVHPNWWGQPPAVLKGWIDRVFRPGIAYRFIEEAKVLCRSVFGQDARDQAPEVRPANPPNLGA